jgi:hypothetical protein
VATRRSTRITAVNPWIVGGEGQLRDLVPLPPWLFILIKAVTQAFRHYLITTLAIIAIWLWWAKDWSWWQAFILFPLIFLLLRLTIITLYLWYKNPSIPLLARKHQ